MTTYTGAAFSDGPIARLLDLCISSQEPGGAPLEDELIRFCRSIDNSDAARWALPAATVAALLDLASEELERPGSSEPSVDFTERLAKAAGASSGPEHLRMLAGLIRLIDQHGLPDFQALPMSAWEASMKFPRIRQFEWWACSGEFEDYDQGLREGIESEHPSGCHQELPLLAAELQQSLLIFSSKEEMEKALKPVIPWASASIFRDILHLIQTHFIEQH
ncbi:hypothetical protein ACWCPS_30265 [Streptomyces mauvecolor]